MQAIEQEVQAEQAETERIDEGEWQCPAFVRRCIFPLIEYEDACVVTHGETDDGREQRQWAMQHGELTFREESRQCVDLDVAHLRGGDDSTHRAADNQQVAVDDLDLGITEIEEVAGDDLEDG